MTKKGSTILLIAALLACGCKDETTDGRARPASPPRSLPPARTTPEQPAPEATGRVGRRIRRFIRHLTSQGEELARTGPGPVELPIPIDRAAMHAWLARAARLARKPDQAADHYGEAFEASADPRYLRSQATMLAAAGAYGQAAKVYRRILDKNPGDTDVRYNLGVALMRTGQLTRAEKQYLAVLDEQEDHLHARANLGMLYLHLEEYTPAAEHLARAVQLDGGDPKLRDALGQALLETHRPEEAMVQLAKLTHLSPRDVMGWMDFSRAAMRAGSLGRALFAAREARQLAQRQLADDLHAGASVLAGAATDLGPGPSPTLEILLARAGRRALLADIHRHLGQVHLAVFYAAGEARHRRDALEAWAASLALVEQPDLRRRLDSHRRGRGR
jgi:Flp pilus assembly protein TadD